MGKLTTHVLDTARGVPAEGIRIALYEVRGNAHYKVAEAVTNSDGRTDTPILPDGKFKQGEYELIFHTGAYLDNHNERPDAPKFLNDIPIRFTMAEDSHFHVPLLLSPYGYSTYRGS